MPTIVINWSYVVQTALTAGLMAVLALIFSRAKVRFTTDEALQKLAHAVETSIAERKQQIAELTDRLDRQEAGAEKRRTEQRGFAYALLVLVQCAKGQKLNGELDKALTALNRIIFDIEAMGSRANDNGG